MKRTSSSIYAYALAIGGAAAAIAGTALAHSGGQIGGSGCDVLANAAGGGFALEAVYHAQTATQGTYRFSVQSAGGGNRTNINQGGGFSAQAGEALTLGRINVGGAAAYDVTLTVETGGEPVECGGRVSASV